MATIDDKLIDKGKGIVESTKDYATREVKYGFWDKFKEGTLATIGGVVGYVTSPYSGAYKALTTFVGAAVGFTVAQLATAPFNLYHNIKSFFQYGKEVLGGGKKKTESPKSPSGSPQPSYAT